MNIFYLDSNPLTCAQMHCDKHVVKMLIEYAQILSTAHRCVDGTLWYGSSTNGRAIKRYFHPDPIMNQELYKATHINHPSTLWARQSTANYQWLYDMWCELGREYKYRYQREHATISKLEYFLMIPPLKIKSTEFTQPPPAMKNSPECIVENDSIASYRNYYLKDKAKFATWKNREAPYWWSKNESNT